jgi:hypothetical protein
MVTAVLVVAVIVAATVWLTRGGGPAGSSAAAPPPAYDPPSRFDPGRGTALPRDADADPVPAVLRGFDAFLALPDGLQVVDTRSGDARATVQPPVQSTGTAPHAPVPATVGGRPAVLAAFPGQVPGHGTTVAHPAIQLLAVDVDSLATLASPRIDLPASLTDTEQLRDAWPVAVTGRIAVLVAELGAEHVPTSYAVDLGSGRVLWQQAGFAAAAVIGTAVVGVQSGIVAGSDAGSGGDAGLPSLLTNGARVAALRVADGGRLWGGTGSAVRSASVWPAGPALIAAETTDSGTGARTLQMLDAGTGAVRKSEPAAGDLTCRFDEASTVVCYQASAGSGWTGGFDAGTGRRLWQLPDAAAGRVAPRVSTAWHGVVYGTTDNGTVALDARTGADRQTAPGVAPDLVNAYVGLTAATLDDPRPAAHLAVG